MIAREISRGMPDLKDARILLLGGTGEAAQLARRIAERWPNLWLMTSLAGRTQTPHRPLGQVRIGGFGGSEGLASYIRREAVTHLINATHPYAVRISANASAAAGSCGIPLLRLLRKPWQRDRADIWLNVPTLEAAASVCKWYGRRIFLTLGSSELRPFAGNARAFFLIRMIDPPQALADFPDYRLIAGRGPFALRDERRLMLREKIDLLVSKNSGGVATEAKILAARELAIPVLMIDRPAASDLGPAAAPDTATVHNIEESLQWLAAILA